MIIGAGVMYVKQTLQNCHLEEVIYAGMIG
jgi:hypothetical protein